MDMKQPQPALFGQYLMITSATPYGTLFQNNQALRYALSKDWLDLMQLWRPTVPAGTYFDIALHNEGYASHWTPTQFQCDNVTTFSWTRITLNDTDYKNVNFPAIWYGGWYDIFIGPQIQAFKKVRSVVICNESTLAFFVFSRGCSTIHLPRARPLVTNRLSSMHSDTVALSGALSSLTIRLE